jgi:hypothetical protein
MDWTPSNQFTKEPPLILDASQAKGYLKLAFARPPVAISPLQSRANQHLFYGPLLLSTFKLQFALQERTTYVSALLDRAMIILAVIPARMEF